MPVLKRPDNTLPKYMQIAEVLRREVQSGKLRPGDRLPSFNEMRAQHGAVPTMMNQVYGLLERDGLIERKPGSGVYVALQKPRMTGSIGFLGRSLPNRARHPYMADLLEGIRHAAHRQGREVLLMDAGGEKIRWEKIDAVLGIGSDLQNGADSMPPGVNAVSLISPAANISSVVADELQGGYLAANHLLSLGHRRIAYLRQAEGTSSRQRLDGYRRALVEAGIKPQAQWIRVMGGGDPQASVPFVELGRRNMESWLQSDWKKLGCTALLTQNDDAAMGTIEALQEAGLRVPEDVSVVGFDGTEVAEYYRPRLTTVALPLYEIGVRGVELLDKQMQNESTAEDIILPVELKIGDSTASV